MAASSSFRGAIAGNLGATAKSLTHTLKQERVDPSTDMKVYRAKAKVVGEGGEAYRSSFRKLDAYKKEFESVNEGSKMEVHTTTDDHGVETFHSASIAPAQVAQLYEIGCQVGAGRYLMGPTSA